MDERAGEPLTEEDYASVLAAAKTLSGRYRSGWTLNEALARWRLAVKDIESGFDTQWIWEYHDGLSCRDWLAEAWPILSARVRAVRQPFLDAWDDRFIAATAPMRQTPAVSGRRDQWWHGRYPSVVTGDPGQELPAPWSPAPTFIEDD